MYISLFYYNYKADILRGCDFKNSTEKNMISMKFGANLINIYYYFNNNKKIFYLILTITKNIIM